MKQMCKAKRQKKPEALVTLLNHGFNQPRNCRVSGVLLQEIIPFSFTNHFESGFLFLAAKSTLIRMIGKSKRLNLFMFKC